MDATQLPGARAPRTPIDGGQPQRVLPTVEAIADALIQYETGGCCQFGRTCGLCDCGRSDITAEQLANAHDLGRARAVLELFGDLDQSVGAPESEPQKTAPSVEDVARAIEEAAERNGYQITRGWLAEQDCKRFAEAALDLFAGQPTVEQVKAEAAELANVAPRFWNMVDIGSPTECWPWRGARLSFGHGRWDGPFGSSTAHRYAWGLTNAAMPDEGLVVRHRCDNPICCNPAHLEVGTQADNVQDMITRNRASFTPTTCRNGHPRTPENTLTKADGTRRCRTCSREQQRNRRGTYAMFRCPECNHTANIYNLSRHIRKVHGQALTATEVRARADRIEREG